LQINEAFAGQEGQCPSCGRTMLIPSAEESGAGPVPAVAEEAVAVEPDHPPAVAEAAPQKRDEKLTNHGGGPLPNDSDFFADPPEQIGPVLSAHTTLTARRQPWSAGGRMVVAGFSGMAGLLVGAVIVVLATPRGEFWQILWPTVGTLLGVGIAYGVTRFSHVCTYVGRDGVAKFTCFGSRDRVKNAGIFYFRDALELRTGQTVRYVNGVYQGTDYSFTWTDVGGRPRHVIGGTYRNAKGPPVTTDLYHYGRAAEMAWTVYLFSQVQRQVELAGSVAFTLKNGHTLRIAPGKLILQMGGEPVEWNAQDIGGVLVDKGVVKIKRADAQEGWFSATGVVKFPFDSLANARLFFHLVDKLLGVRVG
jgi:hypothetical protein